MLMFRSLQSDHHTNSLKAFCDLLKSHNNKRYKFIINSCNNKLLSCHYLTTIDHIELGSPICQFISHFIKQVPYSGLLCGIICSSYLSKILELLPVEEHLKLMTCLDQVKCVVLSHLEKNKKKVDIEGRLLVSLVKCRLNSLSLDSAFVHRLAVSTVKASLNALDESSQRLGHISIKMVKGADSCESVNGVVYKLEDTWVPKTETILNNNVQIILFTEPLDFPQDKSSIRIEEFLLAINTAKIGIVACQKTMNKKLMFLLRRHNIISLERLGQETTQALAQLSGAFLISDFSLIKEKSELVSLTGVISHMKCITLFNEDYLLLERDNTNVVTLIVSHLSFDTLDQLKAVLKECLHTLNSFMKSPYFLPEEFDIYLAHQLKSCEASDPLYKKLLDLFAATLEEVSISDDERKLSPEANAQNVYVFKKNCFAQSFLIVANILQVGLIAVKN